MTRYIGLDVHAQSCTLAVVGPSGRRIKTEVVETNERSLVAALRLIPAPRHLCIEEGTHSAWLHEVLTPHVDELIVMVPPKRKGNKSDARDAWHLAEDLRRGTIDTRVYKAPPALASLRNAVRAYSMVTRDVTRAKNRLRALFRSRGLQPADDLYEACARKRWIAKLPASHRFIAELFGEELDALLDVQANALEHLHEEAARHSIVARIATAPGMGIIRASAIVAIVVTPHRFRTKRQFWSYCGFALVTRTSADWERHGKNWVRSQIEQTRGLNRNRHPMLKSVFKGAATAVISNMSPEHPLHQDYQRSLTAGTKPNLAKLTLARRIAAAVLAMWKTQEDYDPAKHRRQPEAA
jgi:transposase